MDINLVLKNVKIEEIKKFLDKEQKNWAVIIRQVKYRFTALYKIPKGVNNYDKYFDKFDIIHIWHINYIDYEYVPQKVIDLIYAD